MKFKEIKKALGKEGRRIAGESFKASIEVRAIPLDTRLTRWWQSQ